MPTRIRKTGAAACSRGMLKSRAFPSRSCQLLLVLAIFLLRNVRVEGFAFLSSRRDSNSLVEIVPACIPRDLDAIRECRQTALEEPETQNTILKEGFFNANGLIRERKNEQSLFCVLARKKSTNRVLGTVDVVVNEKSGRVRVINLFVRKDERGKGLGKRIMMAVEDLVQNHADDSAKRTLSLTVKTQNAAALSLYRQCGYILPGIHSVISFAGETFGLNLMVTMEKML